MQQRFDKEFEGYFYMKIIVTIIYTNLVTSLLLRLFLSFRRNQKQESYFPQVADLVKRNITFFVYNEWCSTSKVYQNQQTFFIKVFSCILFLLEVQFHGIIFIMIQSKLIFIQKDYLCEIIHNYSVNFDKFSQVYKERDTTANAQEEITKSLKFIRHGTHFSIF